MVIQMKGELYLLSKLSGDQTDGFRWSKSHPNGLVFVREVGVFSYLVLSLAKSHPNGWDGWGLNGRIFLSQILGLSG